MFVEEAQRPMAIGKKGQNIRLATELTGYARAIFRAEKSDAAQARDERARVTARASEMKARGVIALGPVDGVLEDDDESDPRALPEVIRLFEGGMGNDRPGVRGTMWAAYNAVTEYMQHAVRGTEESRLDSLAWGTNAKRSAKALSLAVALSS